MSQAAKRPLAQKGHRPYATGEPHVERVLAITMAVATEVVVLRERLDTVLRLAGSRVSGFTIDDVEAFDVTPEIAAERDSWRQAYLSRILRILHEAVPEGSDDHGADYKAVISEVSSPVDPR